MDKSRPGRPFDAQPIAVGEALCRSVGKCLCATVKLKAQQFFHPFQFGVACPFGAEKNGAWIKGLHRATLIGG